MQNYLHICKKSSNFAAQNERKGIIMVREMTLHQAKMDLLRVVDRIKTMDEILVIRNVLANYYAQKAEEEMDRLWDNGSINEQVIEQWGKEHMRTPYNYAQ